MHAVQQGSMATTTPHRARPLGPLDPRSPAPWWGWTSQPLVRDEPAGGWIHDRTAEARLVGQRHGWSAGAAELVIAERTDRITDLTDRGVSPETTSKRRSRR
jgi:hypothetical protein